MAASVTIDKPGGRTASGSRFVREGTINLATYATNGVAVTKALFDLPVDLTDLNIRPSAGYMPEFDKTNLKVKVYQQKDPAAAGGADIALPEVGNNTDLSAVNFRFRAEGH